MAVLMQMQWDDVTPEQYEAVRQLVNWEGDHPKGGLFHVAGFAENGLRVVDLWDSVEDFQAFAEQRLMPGVKQLGLPGEPRVEVVPVHATFTPAFEPKKALV